MRKLEFYTLDEAKDELIGKVGEPERDEYEAQLAEALCTQCVLQTLMD